jgi:ELWxxDGT repeat protein
MIFRDVIRYFSYLLVILLNQACYLNAAITGLEASVIPSASDSLLPSPEEQPSSTISFKSMQVLSSNAQYIEKREFGNYLLFIAGDDFFGQELWILNKVTSEVKLLKDICSGNCSSQVSFLTEMDGFYFFYAYDDAHGSELWKTDGTTNGTTLVKDIEVGSKSSRSAYSASSIVYNSKLYFVTYTDLYGDELWHTDGSESGTKIVADVNPGIDSSNISNFIEFNSKLFFSAYEPTFGDEIWSTDGTAVGTTLLKDINVGIGNSYPRDFNITGGKLVFVADDGINGRELWSSDGTNPGTSLLINIRSGSLSSSPASFKKLGNLLYFSAKVVGSNYYPWVTDGTFAGTYNLVAQTQSVLENERYIEFNGVVYFFTSIGASYGLWKTDGTVVGTQLVKDDLINGYFIEGYYAKFPTKFCFGARPASGGVELWCSDGTTVGTQVVKVIIPGPITGFSFQSIQIWNNPANPSLALMFTDDNVNGKEPWITDGTTLGTNLLKNIGSGKYHGNPLFLTSTASKFFFIAAKEYEAPKIWETDGTLGGTNILTSSPAIPKGSAGFSSDLRSIRELGDKFFFKINNEYGEELWLSDETTSGTRMIKDILPGASSAMGHLNYLITLGGKLFFDTMTDQYGRGELWSTDGTEVGTDLLKDIYTGTTGSELKYLTSNNGKMLFTANDGVTGIELWVSDGTSVGTSMVSDLTPGITGSSITSIKKFSNKFLFDMWTSTAGTELWISDGTAVGTQMIKDIRSGVGNGLTSVFGVEVNGYYYFSADDGITGKELWKTDGTSGNTSLVKDLNAGIAASMPSAITKLGNSFIFIATTVAEGAELWISDGSEAGTMLLKDINPGASSSSITVLGEINANLLIFKADDGTHGQELWVTDGTISGTKMIKDFSTDTILNVIDSKIGFLNNKMYFFADDGIAGYELWSTDGTDAGTKMQLDYIAGPQGLYPNHVSLGVAKGKLYFTAQDASGVVKLFQLAQ